MAVEFGAWRVVAMGLLLVESGLGHFSLVPPPSVPSYPMPGPYPGRHVKPDPQACHKEEEPACSCNCNFGIHAPPKDHCKWILVFKAVSGQGHNVYHDFIYGGNINRGVEQAQQITSDLRYRDDTILDAWHQHYIKQIKIEIFSDGIRRSWIVFNALGSGIADWMSQDNIIESLYTDIKSGSFDKFSLVGDRGYPISFITFRQYGPSCEDDCGYLFVSDGGVDSTVCTGYTDAYPRPYFVYGTKTDSCSLYASQDAGVGDRFVISVMTCDKDHGLRR